MGASRIVFEDGGGRLGPLTDLRCACEVRSGALLGWQRLGAEALFVPAVRDIFSRTFGSDKLAGGNELTSVATGLALRGLV